jgi:subtilisin family serine protease
VELGVKVTVLQTPEGWSAPRGLKRLRKLDPLGTYDYNHIYFDVGEIAGAAAAGEPAAPGSGGAGHRVGLIDGGVEATHEALRNNVIQQFSCDEIPYPACTARRSHRCWRVPPRLFRRCAARAVVRRRRVLRAATGGAVDAVAAALGWMVKERVAVVNISLAGRATRVARARSRLLPRPPLIVAAVGNDGPAAPPLYPAAYKGLIGVTAVDASITCC